MKKQSDKYWKNKTKRSQKVYTSTAIVLLDQAPFLKKALSRCKRRRNELSKKQKLLSEYEDQDQTAFQQWLSGSFGAKLSKVRELEETVDHYTFILDHLAHCSFWCPDKLAEVHKELFERKKDGTLFQFVPPIHENPFDEGEEETLDDEWEDEADEWDVEDIFDEIFGNKETHSDFKEAHDFRTRHSNPRKAIKDPRLKKCYRALAKRLHPDHSTLNEAIREKRWHEIQEAYQNNNLEALLRVEAICDLGETELSTNLGLARLADLANYHLSHLQPIRRGLSQAKQDIAFGFTRSGPTREIKDEMVFEFDCKCSCLESQIMQMQQLADSILLEFLEKQKMRKQPRNKPVPKKQQFAQDTRQMNLF